ncbi:unnamed protein product, partial [Cuscuta epithymum]
MSDSEFTSPPVTTPSRRVSNRLALMHNANPKYKRLAEKSLVYKEISNRKVNTFSRLYDSIQLIKSKLLPAQLQLFSETVFGKFLHAKEITCCGQLLHLLLGNLVELDDCEKDGSSGFHFEIENRLISFSVSEFTEILGLRFDDHFESNPPAITERGVIWTNYFPTRKTRVFRSDIKNLFKTLEKGQLPNDDIVKLSLLFVLSHAFLAADGQVSLNKHYINLVDNLENFNSYPWGSVIWADMINYFKAGVDSMISNKHYNVYSCVMALQVWAYEVFPALKETHITELVDTNAYPLILRWSSTSRPSSACLKRIIFSNPH